MNPYLCKKRLVFKFLWLSWFECFLFQKNHISFCILIEKWKDTAQFRSILLQLVFHQPYSSPLQPPCSVRKKRWKKGILLTVRFGGFLASSLGRALFDPSRVLWSVSTCYPSFLHFSPAYTFPSTVLSKCWLPQQFVFSPDSCRDGLH